MAISSRLIFTDEELKTITAALSVAANHSLNEAVRVKGSDKLAEIVQRFHVENHDKCKMLIAKITGEPVSLLLPQLEEPEA